MKEFIAKVKHDKGTAKIRVYASSKEQASINIQNTEYCPANAILSIKEVK